MTALPNHRMTVDEYLAWAEGRPGRFELYAGIVYAMPPERAGHAEVKYAVQTALLTAIRRAGVPCHMLPGGMTVRVDRVEVLLPSTRHIDASAKLAGYFRIPSVRHYLIVDPDK